MSFLAKFGLLSVILLGVSLQPVVSDPMPGEAVPIEKWEKQVKAFEDADKVNPPKPGGYLFIGSSSIVGWRSLAQDYPDKNVINRGFGGSVITDSTRLADRLIFPYKPKMALLYAGDNDIAAGHTAEQVLENYKDFVAKVKAGVPGVKIAFISIKPSPLRWKFNDEVKKANKLVEDYSKSEKSLQYIDIYSPMLGKDGKPLPDIFKSDNLHMNEKGYAIWAKVVKPYLK